MENLDRNELALKFMLQLSVHYNNSVDFTLQKAFELADAYILKLKTESI